ncbi:MAG: hypothetical protein GY816_12985, partial [Cytophagales bacterium]|nr:hypothetical protein [Cytophagales bacterium]
EEHGEDWDERDEAQQLSDEAILFIVNEIGAVNQGVDQLMDDNGWADDRTKEFLIERVENLKK